MTVLKAKISGSWTEIAGDVAPVPALTPRAGVTRSIPTGTYANASFPEIAWGTTLADTNGFIATAGVCIIPASMDGVYCITCNLSFPIAPVSCYLSIIAGNNRYDFATAGSGRLAGTVIKALVPTTQVYCHIYNGSGGTIDPNDTDSRFDMWRVSI